MAFKDDTPGVIAPPPLLFLGALVIGAALDYGLVRVPIGLPGWFRLGAGAVLTVAAVGLLAGAFVRFRHADTPVEPWRPSTALVTDGVYRFTRNPIYLAMALAYLGLALAVDSVALLALLPPLLALVQVGVVARGALPGKQVRRRVPALHGLGPPMAVAAGRRTGAPRS